MKFGVDSLSVKLPAKVLHRMLKINLGFRIRHIRFIQRSILERRCVQQTGWKRNYAVLKLR
jgi:hypothetical protein